MTEETKTLFQVADLRHDADLEVAGQNDGYVMSSTEFSEAVAASARVVEAAQRVAEVPFGQINPRHFYALREALRPFANERDKKRCDV